jgi:hypothetical protein
MAREEIDQEDQVKLRVKLQEIARRQRKSRVPHVHSQ